MKHAFLTIITLILATYNIMVITNSSSSTTLNFDPESAAPIIGEQFTINVTVYQVTNLNCWQITISFNPKILNCTDVKIPESHIFSGYQTYNISKIDNSVGQVTMFCAIEGTGGVSGSGTLCSITFKGKILGVSTLKFNNAMMIRLDGTYLQDPNGQLIPFETKIGVIQIIGQGFTENTFTITYGSETLKIKTLSNSTITNLNYNQTLKAITYDTTGPDNTKGACIITIPQKIMNQTLIALSDNTPLKTFTTELDTLPENETHNFLYYSYSHSTHKIKILQTITGDITGDRKVDITDIATASRNFGKTPQSPNYIPAADINHDEKVDITDISYISKNFGKYLK